MKQSEILSLSSDFLRRKDNLKKGDIFPLREVIREHNRLYHDRESPIISDTEYDQLFHALARLESDYDVFDESSPTARLAILASEQFQKVNHMYPMISLDNTYNVEEVREWNDRMRRILTSSQPSLKGEGVRNPFHLSEGEGVRGGGVFYIQPKYDGLGLALIYRYGKLEQAVTRGSGVEGEDVTITAFEIENIPKEIEKLKGTERMEIRGEVMMSRIAFDHVNRERLEVGERLFANPRNAASGSLRQLDPLVTRSRHLQFFAYAVPQIETSPQPSPKGEGAFGPPFSEGESAGGGGTYSGLMDLMTSWGFEREDFPFMIVDGIDTLCEIIENETKNRKEYFDFDIDGIVLKLNDMTLWDELGRTEHHPRYAIAYKFPAKQVRTKVLSIEHSVGRTGTVTPVANLEAVNVGGVVVRRATLHNYDELARKGVKEGDYVFIMRAGEVIPEVVTVLTELRDGSEKLVQIPERCPVCGTKTEQDKGMVAIYCPNPHCPAKIQGQLEMFVGKQGMNIDGLGARQIEFFLELGWITDFASVFQLGQFGERLLELEGYKEKSVNNLMESLEKARHTTLDRVLVSLGIPNVGKKTARLIAKKIQQTTERNIFSITDEELLEVKDIGPETARAFVEYMQEDRVLVERLFKELDIKLPEANGLLRSSQGQEQGALQGKSFCVTGSFENLSRDQIHEMIEAHGGEVRTAVTGKIDYLIAGESVGSKKTKAESLGVKIIGIEEFLVMLK